MEGVQVGALEGPERNAGFQTAGNVVQVEAGRGVMCAEGVVAVDAVEEYQAGDEVGLGAGLVGLEVRLLQVVCML